MQNNILTCNGLPSSFAGPTTVCPTSIGNTWAETAVLGGTRLYRVQTGRDGWLDTQHGRGAHGAGWRGTLGRWPRHPGSTFDPSPTSPRVVPIGVMDIDSYLSLDPTGDNGVLRMVNIYGFFIEGMGNVDRNTGAITMAPTARRSSAES